MHLRRPSRIDRPLRFCGFSAPRNLLITCRAQENEFSSQSVMVDPLSFLPDNHAGRILCVFLESAAVLLTQEGVVREEGCSLDECSLRGGEGAGTASRGSCGGHLYARGRKGRRRG